MVKMIQMPLGDVTIRRETAQAVQKKIHGIENENPIKLSSLGLLVNLSSYPSSWELSKTELYKRYGQDGERSVKSAWKDLEQSNYIIEFKYREGKKWEYVYYYRTVPFTEAEKEFILTEAKKEHGEIWGLQNAESKKNEENEVWGLQNEVPKMKNTKRTGKLSSLKELSSLNKEEEEEHSNLVNYLVENNIDLDSALLYEKKIIEKGLTDFKYEDVLEAIKQIEEEIKNGFQVHNIFSFVIGRIPAVKESRIHENNKSSRVINKSKNKRSYKNKDTKEIIPEGFEKWGTKRKDTHKVVTTEELEKAKQEAIKAVKDAQNKYSARA